MAPAAPPQAPAANPPVLNWANYYRRYNQDPEQTAMDRPTLQVANTNPAGLVLSMDLVRTADAHRASFDQDKTPGLSLAEFTNLMRLQGGTTMTAAQIAAIFNTLDRRGGRANGVIDTVELAAFYMVQDQSNGRGPDGRLTYTEMLRGAAALVSNTDNSAAQFVDAALQQSPLEQRYQQLQREQARPQL